MKKKKLIITFLALLLIPINTFAYSSYIIASGSNIGIELNSSGISVVGLYKVGDSYPAKDAGIEVGDIITSIDDNNVSNINDMISKINSTTGDTIKIGYIRNDMTKYTNLKLVRENEICKTGLYVRDSISGIGTLTYIDPNTKIFGALGHEITDNNSGIKLDVADGKIYTSVVTGSTRSEDGVPGEKNARYNSNDILGSVAENTIHGVFGTYTGNINETKLYKVATPKEVEKGKAKILTVIKDSKVEAFDINILKINTSGTTKNILFEITDERLLNETGGIVQGMSGSPIVQGDYIVGAVTHVIVDSPKKGYGIFITNMLEEGEN
ncbi:MAG: SpoIVB peptidase [Bacilli bacterium]|nr:SpoIVB peptidase [Bacilli bacterium]